MKKFLVLAVLAVALIATPAMAGEGFYLGGYFSVNDISGDSAGAFGNSYINSLDSGPGFGLRMGVGFNRYVSLQGSYFASVHSSDTYIDQDLTGLTLDLKLNFPLSNQKIEPYILAGIGSYELGDASGTFDGGGVQFGIGLDIYFVPELSLNTGLTWRSITFDSNDFGYLYDINADVTTFDIGLTYHFI